MLFNEPVTDQPMTPTAVMEGQELLGTNGAQAPLAFFTDNAYLQGSKQGFHTSDDTVCRGTTAAIQKSPNCTPVKGVNLPGPAGSNWMSPNGDWWVGSKPSQMSYGGMFFTDCC